MPHLLQRETGRISICGSLLLLMSVGGWAQDREDTPEEPRLGLPRILEKQPFLGRFGEVEYKNYGSYDYPRAVGVTSNLRNVYSLLGDPLMYGSEPITWVERRGLGVQRLTTTPPFVGGLDASVLSEDSDHGQANFPLGTGLAPGASGPAGCGFGDVRCGAFASLFNYVVVGSDGTDDWQARVIWANEIRTRLTPLTFKMSNLKGLRVDWGTENNSFSALFSPLNTSQLGRAQKDHIVLAKSLMLGAHYERRIGFLNFGATVVNAHQYEPLEGNASQSLKGVVGAIQTAPAILAIRISDNSPQDGRGGPVLHGVRVLVNGEERPELAPFIVRLRQRGDERQTYVADLLNSGERKPLPALANDYQRINRRSGNTFDPYITYAGFDADLYFRGLEFPFWIDHLFYRDFMLHGPDHVLNQGLDDPQLDVIVHEEFAHELVVSSGAFGFATASDLPQAYSGEEYGILYIDLEPLDEFIQSVEVQLAVADDYHIELSEIDLAGQSPNPSQPNYRDRYRHASYFRTVARASGNPQDSRITTVRVRSGASTGLNLYGAHVNGVYRGFEINAEFARSSRNYQYASGEPAPRVSRDAISIQARNRELFPGQRSTISDNAYYVTVTRAFERWDFGVEHFSMGPLYSTEFRTFAGRDEADLFANPVAYNNAILHRLVEDNDDDDRYPDSWYFNSPTPGNTQSDLDGIFPGLDEDGDGIPDTNKNFDAQPDYLEPFLMYMSDPQIYDYGLDLNHNDFIDARENDTEPDYPYDQNLKGLHLYGTLKPARGLGLTLGSMNGEQEAGGAPSEFHYGRLTFDRRIPTLGEFFAQFSLEKVEDGVPDDLSVYSDQVLTASQRLQLATVTVEGVAPFLEESREDPLLFKNSWWWRFFADARWQTLPGLNMRNKVKYEINVQRQGEAFDDAFQPGDRLTRWTMVHKIDYTWRPLPKLSLFSAYKFRYRREWTKSLGQATNHERQSIPIIKVGYRLTDKLLFQLGLQGLTSVLPYTVTDLVRPETDFEQWDSMLMMTNTSRYSGYIVSIRAGVTKRVKEFDRPASTGNEDYVAVFINATTGFSGEDDY
jgi:hypothetical protein